MTTPRNAKWKPVKAEYRALIQDVEYESDLARSMRTKMQYLVSNPSPAGGRRRGRKV